MLQRVAACCSVLQRVAACCSVLQAVTVCWLSLPSTDTFGRTVSLGLEYLVHCCVAVRRSALPCVAVCCSVLQCVLKCVLECHTVCCRSLYIRTLPFGRTLSFGLCYFFIGSRAATCCSVMQCVAV